MKLAEALIQRADHNKRLEVLKARLLRSAKVQEGDSPPEDPAVLLAEVDRVAADLTSLIQKINRTNATARLDGGPTIADAIAERDSLRLRHAILTNLVDTAAIKQDRFSKSEVRFQSTVDIAALQKRADDLAQLYRELDTRIQSANWLVELLD